MPAGRQPYLKAARRQAQIQEQHRQKMIRLLQQMRLLPIQKESSLTLILFLERTSLILIQRSLSFDWSIDRTENEEIYVVATARGEWQDGERVGNQYEIELHNDDGRSREFYDYLGSRLDTVKYIAVCTGDDEMNTEIADHLMLYLRRLNAENICVLKCVKDHVSYQKAIGSEILTKNVYAYDMLSAVNEDRNAILINSVYDDSDRSDWDKWVTCDSFSKMSSRASAEFLPAIVRASGSTGEEAMNDDWEKLLGEEKLDVLGEMEHLRWCAFHFCNGYRVMTEEEFDKRAREYIENLREGRPANPRIGKDTDERAHACLIPYDQLDRLSEKEKKITGRNVNYKQSDINNVLIIPRILRQEQAGV